MLKGIPAELSPRLLEILAEMGHGDTLTIGDANFAAATMAKDARLVRADGMAADVMLDAVLQLFPLDSWVESCVTVMGMDMGGGELAIAGMSEKLLDTVKKHDPKAADTRKVVDRFRFYELAKKSFAVLATGEKEKYGCIIIQKGVI